MNTANYTPGPWIVDRETTTATVRAHNGKAVARCYQGDGDAALISAAPELLAALRDLIGCAEPHRDRAEIKAARAAIARATGGVL